MAAPPQKGCPITKYIWPRVLEHVDDRRKLLALSLCSKSLHEILSTTPELWRHAARRLGASEAADPRAACLASMTFRAPRARGIFLNSLHRSGGLDTRPFQLDVEPTGQFGAAWAVSADGDAVVSREAPRKRLPAWRRFRARAARGGPDRGCLTEVVGACAELPRRALPPPVSFCEIRETGAHGEFWNPAQSNPYGTEVCPCEYRGYVFGAALCGLCGFSDHPLCKRGVIGAWALSLPRLDWSPRASDSRVGLLSRRLSRSLMPPCRSPERAAFAGVICASIGRPCPSLGHYAMDNGVVKIGACKPPKKHMDEASAEDVGAWAPASFALRGMTSVADGPGRPVAVAARLVADMDGDVSAIELRGTCVPEADGWTFSVSSRGRHTAEERDELQELGSIAYGRLRDERRGRDTRVGDRLPMRFDEARQVLVDGRIVGNSASAVWRMEHGHPKYTVTDGAFAMDLVVED